ncbi:MAG TPA: hypothetical protein VGB03_03010 [Acidimicrobiales bacterium]|jgi:hypothetical protein
MKHLKKLAVALAASAAVAMAAPAPAPAATGTDLAINGTIALGSGISPLGLGQPGSGGIGVTGTCAGAGATGTAATAGTCVLSSSGAVTGSCALLSGWASGVLTQQITATGSGISYSVQYSIMVAAGGAVSIQGNARDASGVKTLTGAGVASLVTGDCHGPAHYAWTGTITITG